jgi:hypothetical protein
MVRPTTHAHQSTTCQWQASCLITTHNPALQETHSRDCSRFAQTCPPPLALHLSLVLWGQSLRSSSKRAGHGSDKESAIHHIHCMLNCRCQAPNSRPHATWLQKTAHSWQKQLLRLQELLPVPAKSARSALCNQKGNIVVDHKPTSIESILCTTRWRNPVTTMSLLRQSDC